MSTKIVTFRCPADLLAKISSTAKYFKRTPNTVLLAAVRLFARQLREQQNGVMCPPLPADLLTPATMFPKPESKGGRPRRVKAATQA